MVTVAKKIVPYVHKIILVYLAFQEIHFFKEVAMHVTRHIVKIVIPIMYVWYVKQIIN